MLAMITFVFSLLLIALMDWMENYPMGLIMTYEKMKK